MEVSSLRAYALRSRFLLWGVKRKFEEDHGMRQ